MSEERNPQDSDKYIVRFPEGMRGRLKEAAGANSRTLNAEIVKRLQDSFENTGAAHPDLQIVQGELEQQRSLAEQFRAAADLSDGARALLAFVLLSALDKLPNERWPGGMDSELAGGIARWLTERDRRGAIFSLVNMIEGADPETVETLRNVAGYLEDHDLTSDAVALRRADESIKRRKESANKAVVVGNLGRDPELQTLPSLTGAQVPKPATPRGPVKSPNARKSAPK